MAEPDEVSLDLATLRDRYATGALTPTAVVELVCARIERAGAEGVWIDRVSRGDLSTAARLIETRRRDGAALPLYGVPFAVKDNIDVAGRRTTAACPDVGYLANQSAPVVTRLVEAGALLVGKVNMDQLATGLLGVRSPYGTPKNPFDERFVTGGSSSGGAAAVARGFVSFALATDTAGSGRVPAAFTNLVGCKPTRGLVSTRGVVPTCPSLDCLALLALTAEDVAAVASVITGHDPADPASSPDADAFRWDGTAPTGFRFGVVDAGVLPTDAAARARYEAAVAAMSAIGGRPIPVSFDPFLEAVALVYDGPWQAERLVRWGELVARDPEALLPTVRDVLTAAGGYRGVDVFAGLHRREALAARVRATFADAELLLLPAAPFVPTIAEAVANPGLSARLAAHTAFANVLDLPAIVVPSGMRTDGLPSGVQLVGPRGSDAQLTALAARLHRQLGGTLGATGQPLPPVAPSPADRPADVVPVAVAGAHLSGEPDNATLVAVGARLVGACRTAPRYRLYCLPKIHPPYPGLVRAWDRGGQAIELEIWEVPRAALGQLWASLASPLSLGHVETDDGEIVSGIVCEPHGVVGGREVSGFGGWKRFLAASRR